MRKRDPEIILEDMLTAIAKIKRYTSGIDRAAFLADEKTIDAVVRNLEILGEAVRQLPRSFQETHPGTAWRQIAGLRNRIVHEYFGLDLELAWQIIHSDIPHLEKQIGQLKT